MIKIIIQIGLSLAIYTQTASLYAQSLPISSIDIFGNRGITSDLIIEKTGIHEGDIIEKNKFDKTAIIKKVESISGVRKATVQVICCSHIGNGVELFIGVQENEQTDFKYNIQPTDTVLLPKKITEAYAGFEKAADSAVLRGNSYENTSKGYSLMDDRTAKSFQQKFITYANEDFSLLQQVIRRSGDPAQRAVAAQVIAYHNDKKKVLPDLIYASSDPDEHVRNNATRALAIYARYAQKNPSINLKIPPDTFIKMVHSVIWTDRNKGCSVLEALSADRNKDFLQLLKDKAFPELVEMARWKENGHAFFAFVILGRMAGMKDEDIFYRVENNRRHYLEIILDTIKKS